MKTIYALLICICLFACTKTVTEDVIRNTPAELPSASHIYYSYKAEEVIDAGKLGYDPGMFTPDCTYIYGDTLFIANTQSGYLSLDLYSLSAHKKIKEFTRWTYNGNTEQFSGRIQAISVDHGILYVANEGSCIDVFDVRTLKFITRIGNRNWGAGTTQFLHTHAMAIMGNYIIVRMKNRIQVMLQSEVSAEKYQNISFYSRGNSDIGVNNGFASHQMAIDSTGRVFLTDYVQQKIQVIDTALIKKGDNINITTGQTIQLGFSPQGIALYKNLMYISGGDGSIRIYDRNKKEVITAFKSVPGYTISNAQKLLVHNNQLWITDIAAKKIVRIDILPNKIEEYG